MCFPVQSVPGVAVEVISTTCFFKGKRNSLWKTPRLPESSVLVHPGRPLNSTGVGATGSAVHGAGSSGAGPARHWTTCVGWPRLCGCFKPHLSAVFIATLLVTYFKVAKIKVTPGSQAPAAQFSLWPHLSASEVSLQALSGPRFHGSHLRTAWKTVAGGQGGGSESSAFAEHTPWVWPHGLGSVGAQGARGACSHVSALPRLLRVSPGYEESDES